MGELLMRRREMIQSENATVYGWLYHFNRSLSSSGTKDFDWSGAEYYENGVFGQAYYHKVEPEGAGGTDYFGLKATNSSDLPDLSGDWTFSAWHKSLSNLRGHIICATNYIGTANSSTLGNANNVKSGWSVSYGVATKSAVGLQIGFISQRLTIRISNLNGGYARLYYVTPPSTFSTLSFHHYAMTQSRANGKIYFFVDGDKIFDINTATTVRFGSNVAIGNYFGATQSAESTLQTTSYGDVVDDLYINDKECKWTSDFDPYSIVY